MSAPSPLPNAFLVIGYYLLRKLCVPLGPFAVYVIENDRFTETRCFRQPHIASYYCLEYLRAKRNFSNPVATCLERRGPLVKHRQQNSFNFQARIQRPSDAH